MLDVRDLPEIYSSWRARYVDRDERMQIMDSVVAGDFQVFDPDEEKIESRSPNFIQVALEDTAEAASLIPTVRVQPYRILEKPDTRAQARKMEKIAASYMDVNQVDMLIPRTVMDLAAYGLAAWSITPDFDEGYPHWGRRDPRTCYPEPDYRPGSSTNPQKVLFAREVYLKQLPLRWRNVLEVQFQLVADTDTALDENTKVVLIEYYDTEEIVIAGLIEGQHSVYPAVGRDAEAPYHPVLLRRVPHGLDICPVVLGARITLDGEFRGQFDQVVSLLEAHIRLTGMVIDYADQSVYSDIWVRDLIGEMPYGGGAFIELGPNGAIGRVPPAVSSLNIEADLEHLVEGIHLGGRWPASRPGEIDQSIASAKFLEASAGMLNTAIRTYHQILQRMLERAIRCSFLIDRTHFKGSKKPMGGVLRNQEFLDVYDPDEDIDTRHRVRVEYGLGMGRDPAQSAVLHIQYSQNEYISKEFVQENIDGLRDVAREQARIDREKLQAMAFAKLLEGIQTGTIPDEALVEIAEGRERGEDIFDLYRRYIVEPRQQAAATLVPTGLGAPLPPGPPVPEEGAPVPALPPPTPPPGAELLSRLNVPAGPGGTLGSQVT